MQRDLFGNIIESKQDKKRFKPFEWSFSKFEVYDDCEKKYYFTYYGSKKTRALGEPLKEKLIELSDIDNQYMVMGDIVHFVIAWALRKTKKGESVGYNQLENFALSRLRDSINYSERYRISSKKETFEFQVPLIKEVVYGYKTFLDMQKEIEQKIKLSLHNFWHSKVFSDIKQKALAEDSIIEGKSNFLLDRKIKVTGKIDLAYAEPESYVITDWKTGKAQYEETSLQLLTYGLWSKTQETLVNKLLVIQKAYLAVDKLEPLKYSENQLNKAKAKIRQQAELLKEMEDFGNNASSDSFKARKMERICKLCPFEKICFK